MDAFVGVLGVVNLVLGTHGVYRDFQNPTTLGIFSTVLCLSYAYWVRKDIKGLLCKSNTQTN